MTRYTDRDCYAALVRAAASLNSAGHDYGVEFTSKASWSEKLEEMAVRMRVPIRRWGTAACSEGPRLVLDHAPSCYGGGVRPAVCNAGQTGQNTPVWWMPSAGLGPGAVNRKTFCEILGAIERAVDEAVSLLGRNEYEVNEDPRA